MPSTPLRSEIDEATRADPLIGSGGAPVGDGPDTATDAKVMDFGDTERPPPDSGPVAGRPTNSSVPPRVVTIVHAAGGPPPPGAAALSRHCTTCGERYPKDFLLCPRDATPLTDDQETGEDPLIGQVIGENYQVVGLVGEGGMGRVYEARHLRLKQRRFAVKILHKEFARNPEMAARFLREAEAASSIDHPNVIDVFDVHHLPDGSPYFVAEFFEGMELAKFVEVHGPLEPRVAASVGKQIANALFAAHELGIVHRDMKPENVFVLKTSIEAFTRRQNKTLSVKVIDFGISKAPSDSPERADLTRTGIIMGTPSYMAPEQARGENVDFRVDIYSLGAILYFALTGKRPFDADDPTSTLSLVLTQDPMRLRALDPRIPEGLELVIQRAMSKDARDRHATMAELEKVLTAFDGSASSLMVPTPLDGVNDIPMQGASRAFDLAKRMLGGTAVSPAATAALAKTARPTIVVASTVLGLWLVGGATAALAGLVRVLHDGEVTLTETTLLVVGCMFAAATPAALYVFHVKKVIWPNSVRALSLATDLARTTTAALVTYGALSIVGRVTHTVVLRDSVSLTSGFWDIGLFIFSVSCAVTFGGAGPLLRNLRRKKRS